MTYKRVHFIGIGGIGTSAMAKLLKMRGVYVSGSDLTDSETLEELRQLSVQVWVGSRPEKIGRDVKLIVYSSAVPEEDEERIRGRHIGAREVSYNAFLGEVTRESKLIAVSGTHGKSTTTAMIGRILIDAGLDPTVVVGSKVPGFPYGNLRVGKSNLFVAEACEHQAHMLLLDPWMSVVNNIELDHPDFYRDEAHVYETMRKFATRVGSEGILVTNGADRLSRKLGEEMAGHHKGNDGTVVMANDDEGLHAVSEAIDGGQKVTVWQGGGVIGSFTLRLPGSYNVENATMAWAVASVLGVTPEAIASSLRSFTGLWRRFEHLGRYRDADVYTDYAHHPTAIKRLLDGTRAFLPGRRITLCFQPHQHARTKGLFDEFIGSMDEADVVILPEIYGVAGRTEATNVSSTDLVTAIKAHDADRGVDRAVVFAHDLAEAKAKIVDLLQPNDVLLMVGAGDIDGLARTLPLTKGELEGVHK